MKTSTISPGTTQAWWRKPYPWLVVLGVLVIVNLLHAFPRYLSLDESHSRTMLNAGFSGHYELLVLHVVTGNIAMVTVFLQLWPWLRRHHPSVHRVSGRLYVFAGALPSAIVGGLVLVPLRPAPDGSLGLFLSAVLWIGTTVMGLRAARKRRYGEHRRWMVYSFALALHTTLGRVLFLMMTYIPGFKMNVTVLIETANWASWVVGLLIAHWWLEQRRSRAKKAAGATARQAARADADHVTDELSLDGFDLEELSKERTRS
ncbi:DUF2306 domain-containing protein [Streptomyces sp. Da 82-17]|uniref:DUF2306 domain-containing protein n=1 Tax=Streptomyces sp. Da 82-17 TaxID=3377116 RepID=UPI0038D394AF